MKSSTVIRWFLGVIAIPVGLFFALPVFFFTLLYNAKEPEGIGFKDNFGSAWREMKSCISIFSPAKRG